MRILEFPIIRFIIFFVLGIVFANAVDIGLSTTSTLVIIATLLCACFLWLNKKNSIFSVWLSLFIYFCVFVTGIATFVYQLERNQDKHYLNTAVKPEATKKFVITKILKPSSVSQRYIGEFTQTDQVEVQGNVLLNVKRDSLTPVLNLDDVLITTIPLTDIQVAKNPGEFDYRSYLSNQEVYQQLWVKSSDVKILPAIDRSYAGRAAVFRSKVIGTLEAYGFESDELAIINALLLGQRDSISPETYNNYKRAGAVHILALSGLHIGILLFILKWLLRPLRALKYGSIVSMILCILMLWLFAFVAGMSASVVRATTMFTALSIGLFVKRPTNSINILAISLLVLLCFKPLFLFDVGFQLSYVAVFSIIILQPILASFFEPKQTILRYFWILFTVTLSAQIGVLPLSLLYFHQFPALFFISNLLILPILSVVLFLGIASVILGGLNILPSLIVEILGGLIRFMNAVVGWVSNQSAFVIENITFNHTNLILCYIFIASFTIWLASGRARVLKASLIALAAVQLSFIYNQFSTTDSEFIIFNKSQKSILGLRNYKTLYLDYDPTSVDEDPLVSNYTTERNTSKVVLVKFPNGFEFGGRQILKIDSLGIYQFPNLTPDIVILSQSPKINMSRMIDSLKPKLIVSDGSNYRNLVARWQLTARQKKIPFHATAEKGAYIINH